MRCDLVSFIFFRAGHADADVPEEGAAGSRLFQSECADLDALII